MAHIANFSFILLLVIISAIVTREDLITGKIRNKLIVIGLGFGFLLYCIFFFFSAGSSFGFIANHYGFYSLHYYLDVVMNFLISIIAAYFFWRGKLWSAGDAKFFILLSFLLPLYFYSNGFLPYFPALALLINIFIPFFLSLTITLGLIFLINFKKFLITGGNFLQNFFLKKRTGAIIIFKYKKDIFSTVGTFLFTFLFISVAKNQIFSIFSENFGIFLIIFGIFYFIQKYSFESIEKIFENAFIFKGALLLVAGYFIFGIFYFGDPFISTLLATLKVSIVFLVGLVLFNRFSNFYINRKEMADVNVGDLAPKTVISEEVIMGISKNEALMKRLGDFYAEGLTADQVNVLKDWFLRNNIDVVSTYKTFSFAPYIFAGAIITVILKQSVVHLFLSFIR